MDLSLGFFSFVIVMMPSATRLSSFIDILGLEETAVYISVLDFLPQRYRSMMIALLCLSSMILLIVGLRMDVRRHTYKSQHRTCIN